MASAVTLDAARNVADALLYEGYLLYPYRASAQKNQLRWQFGVLAPPAAAELGEDSDARVEVIVDAHPGAELSLELRFLRLRTRDDGDASLERYPSVCLLRVPLTRGDGDDGGRAEFSAGVDDGGATA